MTVCDYIRTTISLLFYCDLTIMMAVFQLPGHMQVRLGMCQNWEPHDIKDDNTCINSVLLLGWLKKLQFKMGQIEVQSSAANQFYTV